MNHVAGKVVLVTGAASGIGAVCAMTLGKEGAQVIATDIDERAGSDLANAIVQSGGKATFLPQDVTDENRWTEVVSQIETRFGRLDGLVSNAGICVASPSITTMTLSDWRRQNAINLDGVFLSVKHCLGAMRRAGNGGSIVLMSSVAGLRGSSNLAGYCATKGGVRLFAKAVAMECASVRDNVRVNTVHPGIIDTPIWEKLGTISMDERQNVSIADNLAVAGVPLGYAGSAQDIANGVLYLVSNVSRYMTGAELVIDGGMTAGAIRRLADGD